MKELPKRGDRVKIGKRVCTVTRKQGNDFIGKDDQGQLVGFDKNTPFTIVERKSDSETVASMKAEATAEATEEVLPLAEGELDQAGDSPSALSSELEEKKKENSHGGVLDFLFNPKKKKEA